VRARRTPASPTSSFRTTAAAGPAGFRGFKASPRSIADAPIYTSYSSNIPGFVVGLNLAVTMPNDATYTLQTIGGAANPSAQLSQYEANQGVVFSQGPYGQPYRFSGTTLVSVPTGSIACPGGGASCSASIAGVLFSLAGTHAGFSYFIGQFQGSTPGINGVALFRR
jgi:hypothetical protein